MNKKIVLFAILALLIVGFIVYPKQAKKVNSLPTPTPSVTTNPAVQKQGDTTKTGVVSVSGGVYFLTETGASPKMIDSYSIDFADYVGQTVTVTGQYSGDTLFVSRIK